VQVRDRTGGESERDDLASPPVVQYEQPKASSVLRHPQQLEWFDHRHPSNALHLFAPLHTRFAALVLKHVAMRT